MSDLDADLYGDLYGNDDEGLQPVTGEPESPKEESSTATAVPAQSSAVAKPVSTEPAGTSARTVPAPATQQSLAKPVVPAPLQAQAIQTYQERNEPAAMLPQQAYNTNMSSPLNGDSAQIPVGERSVRPSEMKDEGKMFIGGLNWDTTDEGLKAYFEQFGKVDACTIMRDATGRSRCFAFLTFEDAASVNAVMVREHFLDGKVIDPKRAIPRQEHQRATKLFIGGLAGTVTSESMREFFSQFGKVIDSTVMLDRETGRSKGFGFISLEDADVTPILGFGNLEIDGKLIDIKLAQPRHQRDNQEGGFTNNQQQQQPQQNNRTNNFTNTANVATPQAGTPFDPQALATLYTRMFQVNGGMNMMGGGMNPMGMGNGMGNGMGMGMNPMMMGGGMGMGGMGMGMNGGGMGRGGAPMGRGGHMGMNPAMGMGMGNVPRGPRNAGQMGAPAMGGGMGGGPQRTGQRGQHNYHPYAR